VGQKCEGISNNGGMNVVKEDIHLSILNAAREIFRNIGADIIYHNAE